MDEFVVSLDINKNIKEFYNKIYGGLYEEEETKTRSKLRQLEESFGGQRLPRPFRGRAAEDFGRNLEKTVSQIFEFVRQHPEGFTIRILILYF